MSRKYPLEEIIKAMEARPRQAAWVNPRNIANAFLFLATDEASFISGAVLRVDGGIVIVT